MDRLNGINLSSTGLQADRQPEFDNSASAVYAGRPAFSGAFAVKQTRLHAPVTVLNDKPGGKQGSRRFYGKMMRIDAGACRSLRF
jgi:hypothetical protein